jgi:hypothetical protein
MSEAKPHGSDICWCGDFRSEHAGGGTSRCEVVDCLCPGFRFLKEASGEDRWIWDMYHDA